MTQQAGTELLEIEKEDLARMTSDVVALCEAYRTALRTTPVWKKQDHDVLERVMKAGIPDESLSWSETKEILHDILGSQAHVAHPRFLAFVPSPNNAVSCLGDLLASAYNPFTGSWLEGSGAQTVERVVTEWLASEVGLPAGSGEEKPHVHRFPYCEHMCYAQNRRMSVWPWLGRGPTSTFN